LVTASEFFFQNVAVDFTTADASASAPRGRGKKGKKKKQKEDFEKVYLSLFSGTLSYHRADYNAV
jgi:hypothetical protein